MRAAEAVADALEDGAKAEGLGAGLGRVRSWRGHGPGFGGLWPWRVSRVWALAVGLAVEFVPITVLPHPWVKAKTYAAGWIFFCLALLFFGQRRLGVGGWAPVGGARLDLRFAALHGVALAAFGAAQIYLFGSAHWVGAPGGGLARLALWGWAGAVALVPVTLAGALFTWREMWGMARGLGRAWGYASVCGGLTMGARGLLQMAWDAPGSRVGEAMQGATFRGVAWVLGLFYRGMVCEPRWAVLGTDRFVVRIAGQCSGIEGCALMLGLMVGWLVCWRRELRVGRALLLVAPALGLMWVLNVGRIAALVAIGDAGYEGIALGGFHSEAGWILFSGVALGFLALMNRVEWFRLGGVGMIEASGAVGVAAGGAVAERNVVAVYLLPFLVLVGASLVARAVSDGFEWLYGLRVVAAAAALYWYRREYRRMDWRFGWLGVLSGVGVFVMWVGLGRWIGIGAGDGMAEGLARLSAAGRAVWIGVRVLGAVAAVPVVEELAFRGFLARRIMSAGCDVESVGFGGLSLVAIAGSSLVFGAIHGRMWLAGVVAGVVFCVAAKVRGRLGEAVAAHATANLLIAVWVLARGDYSLW